MIVRWMTVMIGRLDSVVGGRGRTVIVGRGRTVMIVRWMTVMIGRLDSVVGGRGMTFTKRCGGSTPDQEFRVHLRGAPECLWWSSIRNAAPRSAEPKGRSRALPSPPR
jgi:hypothetical protein